MAQNHKACFAIYFLVLLITLGAGSSSASRHPRQTHQSSADLVSQYGYGSGYGPYGSPGIGFGTDYGPYWSPGAPIGYGPYSPPSYGGGGWYEPYRPPRVYSRYGGCEYYMPGVGCVRLVGGGMVLPQSGGVHEQTPAH